MYARIKDNKVVELTTLDPSQYYVATASKWVPCPEDTVMYAEFDGTDTFTAPALLPQDPPRDLEAEAAADAYLTSAGVTPPVRPPEGEPLPNYGEPAEE